MNDLSLWKPTCLAYKTMIEAKRTYEWSSSDYHAHARRSNYQSDWVRAAAYDLSVKQQKWLLANAEFQRKKKLFEKVHLIRWEPPAEELAEAA